MPLHATRLALILFLMCGATAAAQQGDPRRGYFGPSEEQQKALDRCPVAKEARHNFAFDKRNVPANCKAWTDGCNAFFRDESGTIHGTLSMCWVCPEVVCKVWTTE